METRWHVKSIRNLRQARGWSQFTLALKVGVQPQAVYLWERGKRTPQVVPLRRLGVIFGLCSDDIDLERPGGPGRAPPHHPGDRPPGEPVPGRGRAERVATRGHDASASAIARADEEQEGA
jgi:DNA-binding XRE family transcriptional regulator